MVATFLVHVFGLYIHYLGLLHTLSVHCQTRFDLLFSIIMNCVTYSVLYENLTCLISTRLNSPGKTWKMDKWSWKVLENAHKKVLERHRKPLSVFRTLPVDCIVVPMMYVRPSSLFCWA